MCEIPPRGSAPDPHEALGLALKTLSLCYQDLSQERKSGARLRPTRTAAQVFLRTVSDNLGIWPAKISGIERGLDHKKESVATYRSRLKEHLVA